MNKFERLEDTKPTGEKTIMQQIVEAEAKLDSENKKEGERFESLDDVSAKIKAMMEISLKSIKIYEPDNEEAGTIFKVKSETLHNLAKGLLSAEELEEFEEQKATIEKHFGSN